MTEGDCHWQKRARQQIPDQPDSRILRDGKCLKCLITGKPDPECQQRSHLHAEQIITKQSPA